MCRIFGDAAAAEKLEEARQLLAEELAALRERAERAEEDRLVLAKFLAAVPQGGTYWE